LSKHVHKSHNLSVLIYHFVCQTKYRKVIINKEVDETLKEYMPWDFQEVRDKFSRDRNRQESCAFSNTVNSKE